MKRKVKSFIQIGILILTFILSISLLSSISKILGSNQKIVDARKKVEEMQKENKELSSKLQAAKETQFIEQEARDKLGLAKKGEIVVVLPAEDILRAFAPKLEPEKETLPDPNWKKWLKIFID